MSVALKKVNTFFTGGADKKRTEIALQEISEQIRILDQRLVMTIQKEINMNYEQYQKKVKDLQKKME